MRERLTFGWVIGTAAALVGCVTLLNPREPTRPAGAGIGAGIAIALVSGACEGVYTVAAKRFLQAGAPAMPATAITLVISGVALSPLFLMHPAHLFDANSLALIAWLGLAGTVGAYAAFMSGLRRTSAATAGTVTLAELLVASALGVLVLHEPFLLSAQIGSAILLAGLFAVTVIDGRRTRAKAADRYHERPSRRHRASHLVEGAPQRRRPPHATAPLAGSTAGSTALTPVEVARHALVESQSPQR